MLDSVYLWSQTSHQNWPLCFAMALKTLCSKWVFYCHSTKRGVVELPFPIFSVLQKGKRPTQLCNANFAIIWMPVSWLPFSKPKSPHSYLLAYPLCWALLTAVLLTLEAVNRKYSVTYLLCTICTRDTLFFAPKTPPAAHAQTTSCWCSAYGEPQIDKRGSTDCKVW